MNARFTSGRRSTAALGLGLLLLTVSAMPASAQPSALLLDITSTGGARRSGDHETVTATVTNTGTRPFANVLLMLSLADVTRAPAVPLGLEDWTPDPAAARAMTLEPGQGLSRTWRLRMIQAGRVAAYATVVAPAVSAVTNSGPVLLTIESTRNLTPARVLPVILGVPLAILGAVAVILRRRAPRSGSQNNGGTAGSGPVRAAAAIIAILAPAILCATPLPAAAAVTGDPFAVAGEGLRPSLTIAPEVTHAKTGDRLTVTASVTNTTGRSLGEATLFLGLADTTPGQSMPLGLETWTADPESVALPALAPGASASATWHLVMIQPGTLGVYASLMAGPDAVVQSSPLTTVPVEDVRVLNPHRVLPVALGEPVLLLAAVWLLGARRGGPTRPPRETRGEDDGGK